MSYAAQKAYLYRVYLKITEDVGCSKMTHPIVDEWVKKMVRGPIDLKDNSSDIQMTSVWVKYVTTQLMNSSNLYLVGGWITLSHIWNWSFHNIPTTAKHTCTFQQFHDFLF